MNELRIKDYAKFRKDVHVNHKKPYTTKDFELIESDMCIADLSVLLGRTGKAIQRMRNRLKYGGKK